MLSKILEGGHVPRLTPMLRTYLYCMQRMVCTVQYSAVQSPYNGADESVQYALRSHVAENKILIKLHLYT